MRIVPAMDLFDGKVVHGVGGERENYEPVESILTKSANPSRIASKFQELGFKVIYIADLNAIQGRGDNLDAIGRVTSESQLKLMVDAGFQTAEEVGPYVEEGIEKPILATETLEDFGEVRMAAGRYGLPMVASVDMRGDEVVASSPQIRRNLPELVRKFEESGATEMILMNLKKVGSSAGPDYELLARAVEHASVPLLVGGGVRDASDLRRLEEAGAAGALVATALHKGSIEAEDLEGL